MTTTKTNNTEETSNVLEALEDLAPTQPEVITGGPKKIFIGGLSVAEEAEPQLQTREHILLARQ